MWTQIPLCPPGTEQSQTCQALPSQRREISHATAQHPKTRARRNLRLSKTPTGSKTAPALTATRFLLAQLCFSTVLECTQKNWVRIPCADCNRDGKELETRPAFKDGSKEKDTSTGPSNVDFFVRQSIRHTKVCGTSQDAPGGDGQDWKELLWESSTTRISKRELLPTRCPPTPVDNDNNREE